MTIYLKYNLIFIFLLFLDILCLLINIMLIIMFFLTYACFFFVFLSIYYNVMPTTIKKEEI